MPGTPDDLGKRVDEMFVLCTCGKHMQLICGRTVAALNHDPRVKPHPNHLYWFCRACGSAVEAVQPFFFPMRDMQRIAFVAAVIALLEELMPYGLALAW